MTPAGILHFDIEAAHLRFSSQGATKIAHATQTVLNLSLWRFFVVIVSLVTVVCVVFDVAYNVSTQDSNGVLDLLFMKVWWYGDYSTYTKGRFYHVFYFILMQDWNEGRIPEKMQDWVPGHYLKCTAVILMDLACRFCILVAVFELSAVVLPCTWPSVYWLRRSRREKAFRWPAAEEVRCQLTARGYREQDRLSLGMSRFAMRDALLMFLTDYARSQDAWFTRAYETESRGVLLGYDLIEAIKCQWRELGLQAFSVAEVLYAIGHPGVSKATVFISHVQAESLTSTFTGVKRIAESSWTEPIFWLDYFCLGQCVSDFRLERVKTIIRQIGSTALLTERVGQPPRAISRSYCLFEWYATLLSPARKFWIQPIAPSFFDVLRRLRDWHTYDIDISVAQCRHTNTKRDIDEMIEQEIGTACLQELLEAELAKADRRVAVKSLKDLGRMSLRAIFLGMSAVAPVLLVFLFFRDDAECVGVFHDGLNWNNISSNVILDCLDAGAIFLVGALLTFLRVTAAAVFAASSRLRILIACLCMLVVVACAAHDTLKNAIRAAILGDHHALLYL